MKKELKNDILGLFFSSLSLFLFLSLLSFNFNDSSFYTSHPNRLVENWAGIIGAHISHFLIFFLGLSAYSIPLLLAIWGISCFIQKPPQKLKFKFLGFLVFLVSSSSIFGLLASEENKFYAGGLLGFFLSSNLKVYFGFAGGIIISFTVFLLSFILATEYLIFPFLSKWFLVSVEILRNFIAWLKNKYLARKNKKKLLDKHSPTKKRKGRKKNKILENNRRKTEDYEIEDEEEQTCEADIVVDKEKFFENAPELKVKKYDPSAGIEELKYEEKDESVSVYSDKVDNSEYQFPPLDLLNMPQTVELEDNLTENSKLLEECLKNFGIDVKVTEVEQGPVITRYELLPAPGVKLSRITTLQDDIALVLKAPSIRIIAPIPGKSAVGIEVPNSKTNIVCLRELLSGLQRSGIKKEIPLVFGKDISGKPLIADLAKMPHLLIAGSTGSGKTVCLNALIISMFYFLSPDELKFIMIDPKMVELAQYNDIPYLLSPVVTDPKKAAATLNWVVVEMENRYKLFSKVGVRNIQSYNEKMKSYYSDEEANVVEYNEVEEAVTEEYSVSGEEEYEEETSFPPSLPYIVVIVDELADLMMVAADKVEAAIARLAQLARATGIHLILATQRPSVDVITGVIKANFPARVSFKVSSQTDSRTVLDAKGADKLLGRGDMLFLDPSKEKPIRAQGTLISDEEINRVVEFIKSQGEAEYNKEVENVISGKVSNFTSEKDELYEEAVRIIFESNTASVSILQRKLKIGYNRAGRIIDMMEANGIVGHYQGSKPREILITPEEYYASKK